jgi:GT2 family glycosyltransferase
MSSIAVVVLTHNRLHLLQKCVENVLRRTSDATKEIVIWNNASTDGTQAYLERLQDARIKVVQSRANVGQSGYARAFALTSSEYLIDLDDDVVDAPAYWDRALLEAYTKLPRVGFLAANLVEDPNDTGAQMMRQRAHLYSAVEVNGIKLLTGPIGGACAITSRELYNEVGGFPDQEDGGFFLEDAAYIEKIARVGREAAFLADLRVHHAGGPHYAPPSREKEAYWNAYQRRCMRKVVLKSVLLRVPFISGLNARFRWFEPPSHQDLAATKEVYWYLPVF